MALKEEAVMNEKERSCGLAVRIRFIINRI